MIQRILHIKCDFCGAEGPTIAGERRKELLSEVKKLGWQLLDNNTHKCMLCVQGIVGVPVSQPHVEGEDRSIHWTEARKRGD